jgi:hypothetical protein
MYSDLLAWWDSAAVSAQAWSSDLHRAHRLQSRMAVSSPCSRSQNHPCSIEDSESQEWVLNAGKVWWEQKAREWQRAVLHRLVGHVLALRTSKEAPGLLIFRLGGHVNQMQTNTEHRTKFACKPDPCSMHILCKPWTSKIKATCSVTGLTHAGDTGRQAWIEYAVGRQEPIRNGTGRYS